MYVRDNWGGLHGDLGLGCCSARDESGVRVTQLNEENPVELVDEGRLGRVGEKGGAALGRVGDALELHNRVVEVEGVLGLKRSEEVAVGREGRARGERGKV